MVQCRAKSIAIKSEALVSGNILTKTFMKIFGSN